MRAMKRLAAHDEAANQLDFHVQPVGPRSLVMPRLVMPRLEKPPRASAGNKRRR